MCKFESSQTDKSRAQSAGSSKDYSKPRTFNEPHFCILWPNPNFSFINKQLATQRRWKKTYTHPKSLKSCDLLIAYQFALLISIFTNMNEKDLFHLSVAKCRSKVRKCPELLTRPRSTPARCCVIIENLSVIASLMQTPLRKESSTSCFTKFWGFALNWHTVSLFD